MLINSLKSNIYFGHKLVVDIGASDPRISFKVQDFSESGNKVFEDAGFLNKDNIPFKKDEDFLTLLIKEIAKKCKKAQQKLPNDESLTSIALFLPCLIRDNTVKIVHNIKKTDGVALKNIDLNKIEAGLLEYKGVKLSKRLEVVGLNDALGAAIGVVQEFTQNEKYNDMLKPGSHVVGVVIGGGCGVMDIRVVKDRLHIEHNGSSIGINFQEDKPKVIKISKEGASVPSLIANWAESFGFVKNKDIKTLVKTGNARIAIEDIIELDNQLHADAINLLVETRRYKIKSKTGTKVLLKVNDEFIDKFKKARYQAVDKFVKSLAMLTVPKICENANSIVICSKLALGINKLIKENPAEMKAKNLSDAIMKYVEITYSQDPGIEHFVLANDFKIICGDIKIDNNTVGGKFLLDNLEKLSQEHFKKGHIDLPLSVLKN